jgi:hypothetical protein
VTIQRKCTYWVIEHRVMSMPIVGEATGPVSMSIFECADPTCDALPEEHPGTLPCRWSWQYARGKAYNGAVFPKRRCPGCDHIQRAGQPEVEVAVAP